MATWKMVTEIGTSLPECEVGRWYGRPALVVAGKGMLHLGEGDEPMAFQSPEKDDLFAARPDAYFQTPHHHGSPWLLVHLSKISKADLREHVVDSWRAKAPAKLRKAHADL